MAGLLAWVSRFDPFFWDTVQLGSKHAHFFLENGLTWSPLPTAIDSGHPPVFGYYLAHVWHFFGKTLPASHFAMLPFHWLSLWLLWKIGHRISGNQWGAALPLLFLADPVILGQSVLVSPDMVLLTGFLLALEGVLGKRKVFILLGVLILCAISMRGMMTAAALFCWAILLPLLHRFDFKKALQGAALFLPGFLFAAWFLYWHWQACGWLAYHADSPWAGAFKPVDAAGLLRNIAVVGWRFLDFGRIVEWLLVAFMLYRISRSGKTVMLSRGLDDHALPSLLLCLMLFLLPSALLYRNLSAHRYFIPVFAAIHLVIFRWIAGDKKALFTQAFMPSLRTKIMAGILLVLSLATGNLWVYPRGVSMDWDSTLAHWPYHNLRKEALEYLEAEKVDFATVGSAFPNLNTGENLMLNGDQRQFSKIDFGQNRYIMSSNVFNDISGADYDYLRQTRSLVWARRQAGVWIEIYR